jgi:hypothetical protein
MQKNTTWTSLSELVLKKQYRVNFFEFKNNEYMQMCDGKKNVSENFLLKPSKKILRQTLMTKNLTLRFTPS